MSGQRIRLPGNPNLKAIHACWPDRYPYLLESTVQGTAQARYDLLLAASGEFLALDRAGGLAGRRCRRPGFLSNLDEWWSDLATHESTDLPFSGGWFLYLGYELAGEIEPRLELPEAADGLPVAHAARCPAGLVRDHDSGATWLVGEPGAEALVQRLADDAKEAVAPADRSATPAGGAVEEEPPERYRSALQRIHEYILAGDVFQVNLSRAWSIARAAEPVELYTSLCAANPAPFAGLARFGDRAVISSSPERLVSVRGERIETRPIAGTRPRSADRSDDAPMTAELIGNPKERAEHIMLIDLERNDLGRVCEPGSVEVNELMVVESYAHVHHIVSNVRGTLRPGIRPSQSIRAVFPGGTITGCPKVRCMEIIAELEGTGRGAYTGSMGYLNRDGSLDLNILIRTVVSEPGRITFRAGAGIVADSQFPRELAETRSKAKGLLLALGAVHP